MPKLKVQAADVLAEALDFYQVPDRRKHSPEFHRIRNIKIGNSLLAAGFPVDEATVLETARDLGFVVIGRGIYHPDE